jgi:protein-arginine kinase activator protein McsA
MLIRRKGWTNFSFGVSFCLKTMTKQLVPIFGKVTSRVELGLGKIADNHFNKITKV